MLTRLREQNAVFLGTLEMTHRSIRRDICLPDLATFPLQQHFRELIIKKLRTLESYKKVVSNIKKLVIQSFIQLLILCNLL